MVGPFRSNIDEIRTPLRIKNVDREISKLSLGTHHKIKEVKLGRIFFKGKLISYSIEKKLKQHTQKIKKIK